jgi:hypothetical protein
MKTKGIFLFVLSALMILAASCKKDEKGGDGDGGSKPTAISIRSTLDVNINMFATLTATLTPEDASTEGIVWESDKPDIATVEGNGKTAKVTGIKEGTANITVKSGSIISNVCVVTVKKDDDGDINTNYDRSSLNGTEYFIIMLDGTTMAELEAKPGVTVNYIGIDDNIGSNDAAIRPLYIWPDPPLADPGTPSGPNFYGEVEGWLSFISKPGATWTGAGINVAAGSPYPITGMKKITDNPEGWYFHMGIKASTANASVNPFFTIGGGGEGNDAKFALGPNNYVDGNTGEIIKTKGVFTRDGEWNEVEIPMAELMEDYPNFSYSDSFVDANVFAFLWGADPSTLDIDAVFIYKK